MPRRQVKPKADALSNKLWREAFRDEIAEIMTASLRSATMQGCAPGAA
jgi:hypothetical protein